MDTRYRSPSISIASYPTSPDPVPLAAEHPPVISGHGPGWAGLGPGLKKPTAKN